MKKFILILVGIILVSFFSGCASVGRDFNYQHPTKLELARTTSKKAFELFGVPYRSASISNKNGDSKIMRYTYAYGDLGGVTARALILEFKEETLNAYLYSSGFPEDTTEFEFEASKKIKVGSSQRDVLNILGDPSGKAICPSNLGDFAKECEQGKGIWAWAFYSKSKSFDIHNIKFRTVYIIFDENGIVLSFERFQEGN